MSATVPQPHHRHHHHHHHHGHFRARLSPRWMIHRKHHHQQQHPELLEEREETTSFRKIWSPPWRKKTVSVDIDKLEIPLTEDDSQSLSVVAPPPPPPSTSSTTDCTDTNLKSCLKVKTLAESLDTNEKPMAKKHIYFAAKQIELEDDDENCPVQSNIQQQKQPPKSAIKDHKGSLSPAQQTTAKHPATTVVKQTRFSTIEVREYPICVGDCPTLTGGPPVSMDWDYTCTSLMQVDDYEEEYPSHERLMEDDLLLPPYKRYARLLNAGHSQEELYEATRLAEILARQRTGSNIIGMWG